MKVKVVLNKCFGGFGLSPIGMKRYQELKGEPCYFTKTGKSGKLIEVPIEEASEWSGYYRDKELKNQILYWKILRDDPALVQVVEELGSLASSHCAQLEVEEITMPNINDFIRDNDGRESIHGYLW